MLDKSTCHSGVSGQFCHFYFCWKILLANNVDVDQMPRSLTVALVHFYISPYNRNLSLVVKSHSWCQSNEEQIICIFKATILELSSVLELNIFMINKKK